MVLKVMSPTDLMRWQFKWPRLALEGKMLDHYILSLVSKFVPKSSWRGRCNSVSRTKTDVYFGRRSGRHPKDGSTDIHHLHSSRRLVVPSWKCTSGWTTR
eukprot:5455817-Amphidinium_carterae.1